MRADFYLADRSESYSQGFDPISSGLRIALAALSVTLNPAGANRWTKRFGSGVHCLIEQDVISMFHATPPWPLQFEI